MIFAYLAMVSLTVLSVLYLYIAVTKIAVTKKTNSLDIGNHPQGFLNVRKAEIAEERDAGRLTESESSQLLADVSNENRSQIAQQKRFSFSSSVLDVRFARWCMLVAVVIIVLGSVSLYERIGYSKEVLFTQDLQKQRLTPEKVSAFLQYRSRRYDRVEDWYYEATDFIRSGNYQQAVAAFEMALEKMPLQAEGRINLLVEYAQAIFYENQNQSSDKMRRVVDAILQNQPNQAIALGLKGVSEFDQENFLGAVLAWQEAVRYNPNSSERIALLSAINKAREAGDIGYEQVPPIITDQLAITIEWDSQNIQWQASDVLLVYALADGQKMPVAIQRVSPSDLDQPILLTNLDALMPTATLAEMEEVDLVVKLANINDNDLTKGRIIGIKEGAFTNSNEIIAIKVAL